MDKPPVYSPKGPRHSFEANEKKSCDSEYSDQISGYDAHDTSESASKQISPLPALEFDIHYPKRLTRGLAITQVVPDGTTSEARTTTSKDALRKPIFYSEVSEFKHGKPDLTMHAYQNAKPTQNLENLGDIGQSSPIAGVAWLPLMSRKNTISLGDPSNPNVEWIELINPSRTNHAQYHFTYEGTPFAWIRTHNPANGVEGGKAKRFLSMCSRKLVNLETNEIVAVFLQDFFKHQKKRGTLRMFKDMAGLEKFETARQGPSHGGNRFMLLTCLTICALLEAGRRRDNQRRSSSGGGGGGGGG